jgi:hypothetical protein
MTIASLIGGDALNGHVQHERYYLASHNAATEVSKAVYDYSWWHAVASISQAVVTILLIGILSLVLEFRAAYSQSGKV